MRKKICYLLCVVILFFTIVVDVRAEDYKVNTLIPVNTVASVETDKFDYKNFVFDSTIDEKGNATLKFEGIQNNTLSKTAISIDVLLFDENKKNIGYLTYCTDKDVSSDNAGFKIRANQIVPFTINVTDRYFVEGKAPKDVRFIAVRDENKYCQIGGYSNYKDLTIEEIVSGVTKEQTGFNFPDLSSFINVTLILILFGVIAAVGAVAGLIKLLKYLSSKKGSRPRKVKNEVIQNTSVPVNDEANKPIDLDSLYSNTNDSGVSLNIPTESVKPSVPVEKKDDNALADMFNVPVNNSIPEQPISEPKVDENTQAIPIDDLYNTISELPEIKEEKTDTDNSSINDLYNSINAANDDNKSGGASIDDLYESINADDEEDDDEGFDE